MQISKREVPVSFFPSNINLIICLNLLLRYLITIGPKLKAEASVALNILAPARTSLIQYSIPITLRLKY